MLGSNVSIRAFSLTTLSSIFIFSSLYSPNLALVDSAVFLIAISIVESLLSVLAANTDLLTAPSLFVAVEDVLTGLSHRVGKYVFIFILTFKPEL